MCGIVGFAGHDDIHLLHKINDVLSHRGPDDAGYYRNLNPPINMAARRLSILDLEHGHQPMASPEGDACIVFNGEIFNSPEIRRELERSGTQFRSDNSDTEVLLQLYLAHGEAMVPRLNGMFAFAIADLRKRTIFGARDRFGIKPLYYYWDSRSFAFSSELKALLLIPWIERDLDLQGIFDYLSFQSVPAPASAFTRIKKLEPGTMFSFDTSTRHLTLERFWSPSASSEIDSLSEAVEAVREGLRAATRRWTLSDVPITVSLSGGLDSSIITGLVSEQQSQEAVPTFTLGFRGVPDLDERPLARRVADRWKTSHTEIELEPDDLLADLDTMIWHLDEPYGGGLPSWFVFKEIGKTHKVSVTGVGGDELFGNYRKWVPYESRRAQLSRLRPWRRPTGFKQWPRGSLYAPMFFTDFVKRELLDLSEQDLLELRPSEELIENLWERSGSTTARAAITIIDLQHQLPNEFLHMVDRFSMAHSVEARTPFLDNDYVEQMLRVAPALRANHRDPKRLLKIAFKDHLPRELTASPKRGFVIPYETWLRGPLRPILMEHCSLQALRRQGMFRPSLWTEIVDPFLQSTPGKGQQVWTLLMLQLWIARYL